MALLRMSVQNSKEIHLEFFELFTKNLFIYQNTEHATFFKYLH